MTGMGDDGARAMGEVKAAGGLTVAQSEESCVVYGMPKAAIERGHAAWILNLDAIAPAVLSECAALDLENPTAAVQRLGGLTASGGASSGKD
jgi:two-component system chemotaxis response regulator CheB